MKRLLATTILGVAAALSPSAVHAEAKEPTSPIVQKKSVIVPLLLEKVNKEAFSAQVVITAESEVKVIALDKPRRLFSVLKANKIDHSKLRHEDGTAVENSVILNQSMLILREATFEGTTKKEPLTIPVKKIKTDLLPERVTWTKELGEPGLALKTTVTEVNAPKGQGKQVVESYSIIKAPKPQVIFVGKKTIDPFQPECSNQTSIPPDVNPNLALVHNATCLMYPEITVFGTWRKGAGAQDHGTGHAVDIMVSDERGSELAAYLELHAEKFGIKYIIWRQHIWSTERSAEGWRKMEDRGGITANHFDHVHVSVVEQPAFTAPQQLSE